MTEKEMNTTAGATGAEPIVSSETPGGQVIPGAIIRDVTEADFETIMELSRQVPVILDMWAPWCGPCRQLGPVLEKAVEAAGGRVVLGKVNVDENPAISQAFQVQGIPAVFLLLGARPGQLFTGAVPAQAVKQAIDIVLEEAAKEGVTGRVSGENADNLAADAAAGAAAAPTIPEELQQAQEKAAAGDYEGALADFDQYLKANPTESAKVEPLKATVQLEARAAAQGLSAVEVVATGDAAEVTDVTAQLAAADAQMNAGDAIGACSRVLAVVAATVGEDRETARARIVEYFTILGDDPIVAPLRQKLMTLLY